MTQVVDLFADPIAADAAGLDVDDLAGIKLDGPARMVDRVDALIKTERRLEQRLQPGVIDDVVHAERLFEQQKPVVVEFLEVFGIADAIDRVAVALQQ